jgi:hypothetical protein
MLRWRRGARVEALRLEWRSIGSATPAKPNRNTCRPRPFPALYFSLAGKVERPRVELPASAVPVSALPVSAVSSAASISGRRIGESYYHVSVVRCYRKHAAGFEDIDPGTAETMTVHPWAGVGRAMVALPPCAHTATDNYFFLEFFVGRSMWLQDSFAGRVRHFLHRRRARAAVGGGARAMQRKPEQNGDRV